MVQIKIERIGDDTDALLGMWRKVANDIVPGLGDVTFGTERACKAWCAEITGFHPKYRFERKFMRANRDYTYANKTGSRGVYDYFNLENGHIYDISSPISWKNTERYYCRIENNELVKMNKKEVEEWLNTHSE